MTVDEQTPPRPLLSIVLTFGDMPREAPRTLHSISTRYQLGIDEADYEVIVVENGSKEPLGRDRVEGFGANFSHYYLPDASVSPVGAINFGASQARGDFIGVFIDGARMLTPRLLHFALQALCAFPRPIVVSLGFHLGPDVQYRSVSDGYNQQVEDELLDGIAWPDDGYRLFEIASLAASSRYGWFGPMGESNTIFVSRQAWEELEGYEEAFDLPGGGMVNLDFYSRACALEGSTLVTLLGEANFHQFHGGVTANVPEDELHRKLVIWNEQWERIRGKPYEVCPRRPLLFGALTAPAVPWVERCCQLLSAEEAQAAAESSDEEH